MNFVNSLSQLNFINKYYSGNATIFMLHRVSSFEPNKIEPNESMKVSPEFLEDFILRLKSSGYEFISIDRLYDQLCSSEKVEKQIVFTLDDGYKDNYEIAYPIFKRHSIPFTIYVTTSFPDHTAILWWYILEDLVVQNTQLIVNGIKFECNTEQQKIDTFMKIRKLIISIEPHNYLVEINKIFSRYKVDWSIKCRDLTMSWAQIKQLSLDPLVTIGGHTKNHYSLNRLNEAEILTEILEANKIIEEVINKKIEHFSYPFGSKFEIGQREFNIIKKIGFKTATTTRRGNIYSGHKFFCECLPRVMLTNNFNIKDIGIIRRSKILTD
jgi:peptidoglycan/xylan/chitin deacetylase (PgdA/CDA1 family)